MRRVWTANSDGTLTPEQRFHGGQKWKRSPTVCLRDTVMHGGHWGGRIPRTCWPPTDDEPFRYEFAAPLYLNFLWISHSIKGRHNGESLFWQRTPAATSIINAILPITSAEPALFGVYADDLLLRWRALRGFRNTLKRRPRVATVAFDGRFMG